MLESYITPMLMGYIDKYVKNIKPSDLQVSFWGGDAVLRNLELRLDVLERELQYPLEIKSGQIRELVLHIPWNAILSKPVEVELKDVEIVVKLKSVRVNSTTSRNAPCDAPDSAPQPEKPTAEQSPQQQGYLQGYTSRILNNLTFQVQNLVVKVIEEECDMMMSFNVQSLKFHMTDDNWSPSYVCTDYCDGDYTLNKVLEVADMVVHLQTIDNDRAQRQTLRDPFVRKAGFSCRMQLRYRGEKFVKKSTCILFDEPVLSADESQFSLFFHLVDWLLAMYYSGKQLKGRDDVGEEQKPAQPVQPAGPGGVEEGGGSLVSSGAAILSSSFEDVLLTGSVDELQGQQQTGLAGDEGAGWGSWVWSFVAADEGEGKEGEGGSGKSKEIAIESSTFSILAKSVTVNLKVTHHGRVPVFSSPRSRSRTVLTLMLSGCSVRVDDIPLTQLFTMCLGVMGLQASASGVCSCSDISSASWKTTSADSHERVPVFSLGDVDSCNTDLVLTGSLFDPEITAIPPEKQPPPLPELLLAPRPEFTALWFTYEYYDVGPQHPVEVCEERLLVGEVDVLVSPDTLHRVSHFTSAYGESAKACPLFSEGMVVIGDPKAETTFKITFTGGKAVIASNTHYLSASSSSSSSLGEHVKPKPALKAQQPPPPPPPPPPSHPLPTLTVSLERSTIHMTLAMYSGNATPETPQRHQMRVSLNQLEVVEGGNFKLGTERTTGQSKKIFTVPKLEVYKHSKTTGEGEGVKCDDSSYLQLNLEELSCVISPEQISKTCFVFSSWYHGGPSGSPRTKIDFQPAPQTSRGHLHTSLKEVELTKSVTDAFTFLSATVASYGLVLLCDSTTGRLCHAVPIVSGPIATEQWNRSCVYSGGGGGRSGGRSGGFQAEGEGDGGGSERLLEFFTAMPNPDHSVESYPTLQLSVAGMAVCLDSAVLEFIKHIPPLSLSPTTPTPITRRDSSLDHSRPMPRGQGPSPRGPPSVHSEDTVTEVHSPTVSFGNKASGREDIIAMLKSYATKVDVGPILIVIPPKPLEEGLMSSVLPEFPVLPALCEGAGMEALLLCLPHLSLISAKSHVLEEPVPKATSTNTLPWDCTLSQASIIAIQGQGSADYLLEPLSVTVTLADQQGGTGVTVHTDTVAVSLSREKGCLMSECVSNISEALSSLLTSPSSEESEDSGIHSSYNPPLTPSHHRSHQPSPSHLSSPAQSTITTLTTLPAHTSLVTTATSTDSSPSSHAHNLSPSSSLWIQAIVTRITLALYAPLPKRQTFRSGRFNVSSSHTDSADVDRADVGNTHSLASVHSKTSSTASFMTPLTSPTTREHSGTSRYEEDTKKSLLVDVDFSSSVRSDVVEDETTHQKRNGTTVRDPGNGNGSVKDPKNWNGDMGNVSGTGMGGGGKDESETEMVKLSLEVEGVSVQFDLQEKSTDLVLKISAVDANLYRQDSRSGLAGVSRRGEGVGRGSGGQWKPYLSSEKILSSKGSALPRELSEILAHSSPAAIHLPRGRTVPSSSLRNFVTLEMLTPRQSPHRAAMLKLKVQSFEAVVWLPVADIVSSVFSSMSLRGAETQSEEKISRHDPPEVSSWPAIEATVECCRFTLPSSDYTNAILCNISCVSLSHDFDYPTIDSRYVVSASAFRRLSHLSGEKKQPPLPAYRCDLLSVSVWGVRREERGSAQVLLYAGSSDIRAVYTPALYWRPTGAGTSHRPAILACGHCVEVNFRTDLDLMLGPEQVECLVTILQTNTLSTAKSAQPSPDGTHLSTTPTATPTNPPGVSPAARSPSVVPFKGLVSGTTVGLTLVSSSVSEEPDDHVDSASESSQYVFSTRHGLDSAVIPLLQLQLFNVLCGVSSQSSGSRHLEASCFNMSVGYSRDGDTSVCSYSDLVDAGMTSSLMESPLLETRQGHQQNTRGIPPSVITVTWDTPHNKPPALTVDISRPVKLTLTPHLLSKLSEFSDSILRSTGSHRGTGTPSSVDTIPPTKSEQTTIQGPDKPSSENIFSSHTHKSTESVEASGGMQVKVKTTQVVLEFQISSHCGEEMTDISNEREATAGIEREVEFQTRPAATVAEEGLVLVWDSVDLAYPNTASTGSTRPSSVTGELYMGGLQLLSIMDTATSPVVLPTQLNCFIHQHIPTSKLYLPYVTVNVSCGLLDVRLSSDVVDLASRVLHTVTDVITPQVGDSSTGSREGSGGERGGEGDMVIHFHDDLRAGDFTYVKDSDQVPGYSPQPGEVFFSLGSREGSTTSMTWHYREPRALTRLSILPVPFSFTSESDAPIKIEVGCTLDYWDEDKGMFSVLEEFRLCETTPTEVVVSRATGSRKWRIAIVEIEWEDEEEEDDRLFSGGVDGVDGEGAVSSIASVLSPVLLAGGTCVDSFFSPELVPVSDLSLTCNEMQATLFHKTSSHPGQYGEYEVVPLTSGPLELARLHVQHLTCHLKQMKNSSTTLKVDGQLSVEFVDFLDLTWRRALCPTHIHASLERQAHPHQIDTPGSPSSRELCDVTVKCSPAVLRVSQGLLHTTSLATHTWSSAMAPREKAPREKTPGEKMEGGKTVDRAPVILNHLILCNNTLSDLHFGQVSTDEVTALQSRQCIGYSWRNNKTTPQMLHLCIVTDGVWRWTKPFSISSEGSQSVDVYIGRHTALVNVTIANIGGLQKKVTFTGNWTFVSALPFPLHISLISSQDSSTDSSSIIPLESYENLALSPESGLPSLVVPGDCLCGVRVRSSYCTAWSEVFPIHSTTEDWNKPQLLTEMEYSGGQRVNLWYNIKPMHTSKHDPLGSKITFSPLFAICNHLPFDITMVATETSATGRTPLPDCPLKGEGEKTILCGLCANTWYHLSFKQSGCESVSEPPVSLSTFLLIHLPFSGTSKEGEGEGEMGESRWPYEDDNTQVETSGAAGSNSLPVKLPLSNGSCCSLCAVMKRSPINTITLHLQPDMMVVNRSPITVQLLTRGEYSAEELNEEDLDGRVEVLSSLLPNEVGLLPQNKFVLVTEWKGKTLLSQPITSNSDKAKTPQSTNVILSDIENDELVGVFVNLTLVQRLKGTMTIIIIKPTYVFHNNTTFHLNVSTCLFHSDVLDSRVNRDPLVVETVASQGTAPLLFWEYRDMHSSGETVQALKLKTASGEEEGVWSLPLSPDFVRHSFALQTHGGQYAQAVLTMHEHCDSVYMVASIDPAPRLLVQNHTQHCLEIVEEGAQGIHGYPQVIPPKQQVTYEPPTYAKQYPLVFDGEVSQRDGKDVQTRMAQVAVVFRQVLNDDEDSGEERVDKWSEPFRLNSDTDRIISISSGESVLISTHRKGITLYLTLLPTGQSSSFETSTLSEATFDDGGERKQELNLNLNLEQFVVCLYDEATEDSKLIEEILQIISDGAELKFCSGGWEGSSLGLTLRSLYVNNMTETGNFAVTLIPRTEHLRRASLIETEPAPLANLSVHYSPDSSYLIDKLHVSVQPLTLQLEDGLLNRLRSVFGSYGAPGTLLRTQSQSTASVSSSVPPQAVLAEAARDVVPLAVNTLTIDSTAFYLSARISLRVLLSCNDSPFRFSRYQLDNIYSNWTEVSQTVASRYIMSTVAHIGWLLGSLELIGSPGTFIQTVGRGLRDLVTLPYQGLTRSPTWFLLGIGQGTMSFVQHLSSGALGSVTSMASSISHNMERLSLDPHHISYQAQQRQERPATHFTRGLMSGASSLGLSLVSAVAGIVEQPMQSYHQIQGPASPAVAARSILTGVGKGLLGAVAKPVGGVMELVSQTGQGLMHGTGLARRLHRKQVELQSFTGSIVRADLQCSSTACAVKLGGDIPLLLSTPVKYTTAAGLNPGLLLLTCDKIYLLNSTSNTFQQSFPIGDVRLEQRDSGNLEEVEIEIVVANTPSQVSPFPPHIQNVEYFLQKSCEPAAMKSVELSSQVEQASLLVPSSPTLTWSDGDFDSVVVGCDQSSAQDDRVRVKLLISTHRAAQLLSFYNSLANLSLYSRTAFCVHRTTKSESFLSAQSN